MSEIFRAGVGEGGGVSVGGLPDGEGFAERHSGVEQMTALLREFYPNGPTTLTYRYPVNAWGQSGLSAYVYGDPHSGPQTPAVGDTSTFTVTNLADTEQYLSSVMVYVDALPPTVTDGTLVFTRADGSPAGGWTLIDPRRESPGADYSDPQVRYLRNSGTDTASFLFPRSGPQPAGLLPGQLRVGETVTAVLSVPGATLRDAGPAFLADDGRYTSPINEPTTLRIESAGTPGAYAGSAGIQIDGMEAAPRTVHPAVRDLTPTRLTGFNEARNGMSPVREGDDVLWRSTVSPVFETPIFSPDPTYTVPPLGIRADLAPDEYLYDLDGYYVQALRGGPYTAFSEEYPEAGDMLALVFTADRDVFGAELRLTPGTFYADDLSYVHLPQMVNSLRVVFVRDSDGVVVADTHQRLVAGNITTLYADPSVGAFGNPDSPNFRPYLNYRIGAAANRYYGDGSNGTLKAGVRYRMLIWTYSNFSTVDFPGVPRAKAVLDGISDVKWYARSVTTMEERMAPFTDADLAYGDNLPLFQFGTDLPTAVLQAATGPQLGAGGGRKNLWGLPFYSHAHGKHLFPSGVTSGTHSVFDATGTPVGLQTVPARGQFEATEGTLFTPPRPVVLAPRRTPLSVLVNPADPGTPAPDALAMMFLLEPTVYTAFSGLRFSAGIADLLRTPAASANNASVELLDITVVPAYPQPVVGYGYTDFEAYNLLDPRYFGRTIYRFSGPGSGLFYGNDEGAGLPHEFHALTTWLRPGRRYLLVFSAGVNLPVALSPANSTTPEGLIVRFRALGVADATYDPNVNHSWPRVVSLHRTGYAQDAVQVLLGPGEADVF